MSINTILLSGLQGVQAGINRSAIASSRIAAFGVSDSSDAANNIVAMRQGAIDAGIAANVIKTGDQLLGTLIDIRS